MNSSVSQSEVPAVTMEGESFASDPKQIEYLSVETPASGSCVAVAPGVLWLRIPMPMDLNHINLWLLGDGDGWTVVDTGINADIAKEAWQKVESEVLSQHPLKRIFLTHLHPDHIGLASWLQERHGVPAWMSVRGYDLVRQFAAEQKAEDIQGAHAFMRAHGFADTEMLSRFFSGKMFRTGISGVPTVAHHPQDGDSLAIGEAHWQVYETNGHAEGHQCLFDASRRILICGDQVLPTISPNVSYSPRGTDTNPLASYLGSLERLSLLDAHTLVLPAHGKPYYGLRPRAADLIAHHRAHLTAVESACEVAKTAFELVPVLFKRRLIGSHWMFAMGETIAHAEYLAFEGRVTRQTSEDGMIRYSRVG
jgi:glyoxylase-like metal-dependent hydrolase (beta-lactamase superfamily II)